MCICVCASSLLEFSMYKEMSSANGSFYFTLSNLDAFHFFFLMSLARSSSTVLYRHVKTSHASHFPGLEGKVFSFSLFSVMLAVSFSHMVFIMLK